MAGTRLSPKSTAK